MPLIKGAKPGSKGFSKNVSAEVKAGKPPKQAVAIAYSEARSKGVGTVPKSKTGKKKSKPKLKGKK